MYREQPETIRIWIRSNPLHFVSLCILYKHYVPAAVVEPTRRGNIYQTLLAARPVLQA